MSKETSQEVHDKANAFATKAVLATHAGVYSLVLPLLERIEELERDEGRGMTHCGKENP